MTSRRPSSATAIAAVALFIALAGSAWAGAKVGTSEIANKAVTQKKIAKKAVGPKQLAGKAVTTSKIASDAVTGAKVDEASLDQVPSAAEADTVGGLAVGNFSDRRDQGSPPANVASIGTLQLRFGCSVAGQPLVSVLPVAGAAEQTARTSVVIGNGPAVEAQGQGTLPASGIEVLDGTSPGLSYNGTIDALTEDGAVTTIQWAARSTSPIPSPNPDGARCLFWGTGTAG